jgi:hypothetical protein
VVSPKASQPVLAQQVQVSELVEVQHLPLEVEAVILVVLEMIDLVEQFPLVQ